MPRDLMVYFRAEARELLQKLSQDTLSFESARSPELLTRLLRHAHTLKGAARVVEQRDMASAIHGFEEILDPYRQNPQAFPAADINRLLEILDGLDRRLSELEAPPVAAPSESEPAAPMAETLRRPVQGLEDAGLGLLSYQRVEVDALLEDLRAASGQIEALRRNLHNLERSKSLGELLLAQLAGEGAAKTARLVAEELQLQLRAVERNLAFSVDQLERELHQAQESTEKLRLVRAEAIFPILRRALRDAAKQAGVSAELVTSGGDLRLETRLLATVQAALVQAVRNSLAHGIEPTAERVRQGKPASGTVTVQLSRHGRMLEFVCRDDGRGVDLTAVRRELERKGVDVQGMDQEALLQTLMQGGVSTARAITQTAGRGIGMDLIRETVVSLGGEITLETEPGAFTRLTFRVPWSVAGMEFLEVATQAEDDLPGQRVLLPLESVRASLLLAPDEVLRGQDGETLVFEGQTLRLLSLSAALGVPEAAEPAAVVVRSPQGEVALSVGALRGTRTATLLPLPPWTEASPLVAGATLDAEGDAQLVLDPEGLQQEALRPRPGTALAPSQAARLLVIDDSLTTRMLQQSILESAGFEVELASSAEEGLEKARQAEYGVILVDVEMPGIDGFTFVERIRSDPSLRHIPAILITSRDAVEDKLRGQAVGAQGYMVKSEYDQKELLRQIRSLLT
jgi:two-component system chemotaxis sensor kinase CheA